MTHEDRQTLREAALAAMAGIPPRTAVQRALSRWELQTSNSFRRIGCLGDGDVLCGTKHPIDAHPDLLAAPGVLNYIVAAQPRVVLQLLDEVDALEDKLAAAKILCDRITDVEGRLDGVTSTITSLGEALAQLSNPDPLAVEKALLLVGQIVANLREVRR